MDGSMDGPILRDGVPDGPVDGDLLGTGLSVGD